MPRLKREVIPGFPYHVTQRGVRRSTVFFTQEDRTQYLERFLELSKLHGLEVIAYCLMDTHVHHMVVPSERTSLERVFRPLHSEYASRVNKLHGWSGHLWQNRYFSCLLEGCHFETALRYIELNPVRAGMVSSAENYQWSSAQSRVLVRKDPLITNDERWVKRIENVTSDWSSWLKKGLRDEDIELIRRKTQQGLPCGAEAFIKSLESKYNIRLSHRKAGRPSK